jgi:SAM-dependent methyltransferase
MDKLSPYAQHSFESDTSNNSWSNMFRFIPDGSRVLDVGCSTGNFGKALKQYKGCSVVGVDLSEADIAEAKTLLDQAWVLDIRDASASAQLGTFDIVVFGDVVEHLPDPRSVLRAVHGLLNPGGAVVYSIPNMGHASVRLDLMDGRFPYAEIGLLDKTHLHFYDRPEVTSVFVDSNFVIAGELPTIVGYPEQWMSDRLASMGLTPSGQFFSMLATTDASVFQFVGIALPAADRVLTPVSVVRETMPQDEMLLKSNELIVRNNELIVRNNELVVQLHELHERITSLRRNPIGAMFSELRRRVQRTRD